MYPFPPCDRFFPRSPSILTELRVFLMEAGRLCVYTKLVMQEILALIESVREARPQPRIKDLRYTWGQIFTDALLKEIPIADIIKNIVAVNSRAGRTASEVRPGQKSGDADG